MYRVYHIGIIAFETEKTKRESKSIGGISGSILELINYSLSQGIHVSLIGKIYYYVDRNNFAYYEIQKKVTSTARFLFHLFVKSLFIKTHKSSVIHAHRPDHLAAFMFFKKRASVITIHGQQAKTVNLRKGKVTRTIYHILEKYALAKVDALIAVDEVTNKFYSSLYPTIKHKLVTIPTGVNVRVFFPSKKNEARKQLGYSNKEKIIVYVGRIEPPKRMDIIIKAFQFLVQSSCDYKLVIVGDGVLMKETQALVNNLELSRNVRFMGVRKRNELSAFYNMSDISVLFSGNEGSPLSVKESLACGVPVVANSVGDIPLIIKNGYNGYITEKEGIEELAEKMQLAIKKSGEMKKQCVASIQEYTTERVSQKIIDLYKAILNE